MNNAIADESNQEKQDSNDCKQLCVNINAELKRLNVSSWFVQFVKWQDCSRALSFNGSLSTLGNNITDVKAFLLGKKGEHLPMFCVGGDNHLDPSVLCSLDKILTVVDDSFNGNARMVEPNGVKITVAFFHFWV